jgi:phage-related protein
VAETQHKVSIILNAQDNARSIIGGLTTSLGGLATAAAGLAAGAVAGVGALGAELADLAMEAAPVGQVQETFDALAESIGEASDAMLADLRTATNSMVSDADLMASANQFMSMGLADSADGAAELAEMATRLGMAMGGEATESMENFALMLANQSIPRLDSFGISSGKVRERIDELMSSTEGLTREQAFMQAVAEQGAVAMERLGDAGMDTAATSMAQLQATLENLKTSVGTAFLPVLETLLGTLSDLASTYGPMLAEWASSTAGALLDGLAPALEMVAELFASPEFMAFAQEVGVALTGLLTQVAGLLINDVLPPLLQLAQTLLPTLTPLISAVLDAVLPLVAELVSRFVPVLVQLLGDILPPILPLFQQLADVVVMVLDAVLPLVTTLLDMLIPVFSDLISALLPALMPLFEGLMMAFVEILTALMPLVEVLLAEFLPILTNLIVDLVPPLTTLLLAVVDVFVDLLQALVPVVATLIEELAPIIAEVAELISTALNIALDALAGLINNVVGPALEWLRSSVIDPLIGAIDGISDAVSGVIDWLGRMTDSLGNIQLPDWLTPGSPTPFENGLRGIADALNEVSGMTGPAFGGLPAGGPAMAMAGGAGPGAVSITVNIGNVSEGNAYAAGQQAATGIRDELRRRGVIT